MIIEQNHLIRSISTDILSAVKEKGERDIYKKSHVSLYTDFNLNFPLNCPADLEKFEEVLKEEDHFNAAVCIFDSYYTIYSILFLGDRIGELGRSQQL